MGLVQLREQISELQTQWWSCVFDLVSFLLVRSSNNILTKLLNSNQLLENSLYEIILAAIYHGFHILIILNIGDLLIVIFVEQLGDPLSILLVVFAHFAIVHQELERHLFLDVVLSELLFLGAKTVFAVLFLLEFVHGLQLLLSDLSIGGVSVLLLQDLEFVDVLLRVEGEVHVPLFEVVQEFLLFQSAQLLLEYLAVV